jgi:hypothetical protein
VAKIMAKNMTKEIDKSNKSHQHTFFFSTKMDKCNWQHYFYMILALKMNSISQIIAVYMWQWVRGPENHRMYVVSLKSCQEPISKFLTMSER